MTDPTYTETAWVNNTAPALSADNLNHIEGGIEAATVRAVDSIRYGAAQSLTSGQQTQAQDNLGLPAVLSGYVPVPAVLESATLFVSGDGNDANSGLSWASAKATVHAAAAALPAYGGTIYVGNRGTAGQIQELLPTTFNVPTKIVGVSAGVNGPASYVKGTAGVGWTFASGATGSVVEDIYFDANGSTQNGITVQGTITMRRVVLRGWAIGLDVDTSVTGNANNSVFEKVRTYICTSHGFNVAGSNSQNMTFINCDATDNTGWGFNIGGSNHNAFLSCHADGNTAGAIQDAADSSQWINPYVESTATSSVSLIGSNTVWIGSHYADPTTFSATASCFVIRKGQIISANPLGVVRTVAGSATAVVTIGSANSTRFFRVLEGGKISKIRVSVGTSSGNIAVAVYANSGTGLNAAPGAQTATSGSVACPAAGIADVALGSSVTVNPGDWLAIAADNATATFAGITGVGDGTLSTGLMGVDAVFPPPATASITPGNNRIIALIGVP